MRCTECSRPVRPVVALDIDGSLGDYHGHFLEFLQGYLGGWPVSPPRPQFKADAPGGYDGSENFGDWICQMFEIDRRTYRDIKLAYRQGAQKRSLPVFPGAHELSVSAHDLGAEVWVATSRPYLRLDNIDPDTRFWLDRHRIPWDYMIYGDDKYKRLAELVEPERVVLTLDDLGEMYDQASQVFGEAVPVLRRNDYNVAVRRPLTASDLYDARAIVVQRVQDWFVHHEFDKLPTT